MRENNIKRTRKRTCPRDYTAGVEREAQGAAGADRRQEGVVEIVYEKREVLSLPFFIYSLKRSSFLAPKTPATAAMAVMTAANVELSEPLYMA